MFVLRFCLCLECPRVTVTCSPPSSCVMSSDGSRLYTESRYRRARLTFVCKASAHPPPSVSWKTTTKQALTALSLSSVSIAMLKDLSKRKHEGVYTCQASNVCGRRSATVRVHVNGKRGSAVTYFDIMQVTAICNT